MRVYQGFTLVLPTPVCLVLSHADHTKGTSSATHLPIEVSDVESSDDGLLRHFLAGWAMGLWLLKATHFDVRDLAFMRPRHIAFLSWNYMYVFDGSAVSNQASLVKNSVSSRCTARCEEACIMHICMHN